jgi:hypothetical protein
MISRIQLRTTRDPLDASRILLRANDGSVGPSIPVRSFQFLARSGKRVAASGSRVVLSLQLVSL